MCREGRLSRSEQLARYFHKAPPLDVGQLSGENGWTSWDVDWTVDLGGPKEPCIRWGPDPPMGNEEFLGVVWPSEKHESLLRSMQQKIRNSIGLTAVTEPTALISQCQIKFSWKIRHLWCGLSSKLFDHLSYRWLLKRLAAAVAVTVKLVMCINSAGCQLMLTCLHQMTPAMTLQHVTLWQQHLQLSKLMTAVPAAAMLPRLQMLLVLQPQPVNAVALVTRTTSCQNPLPVHQWLQRLMMKHSLKSLRWPPPTVLLPRKSQLQ